MILYGCAIAAAVPRRTARVYLIRRQLARYLGRKCLRPSDADDPATPRRAYSAAWRANLREEFDRFDTSGDGQIDATELRVALRHLTGADPPLADCEALVRAYDTDGSGKIEFAEFCDAVLVHEVEGLGPTKEE